MPGTVQRGNAGARHYSQADVGSIEKETLAHVAAPNVECRFIESNACVSKECAHTHTHTTERRKCVENCQYIIFALRV